LIKNDEENDYMTLERATEVGIRQYEQLNDKQKEIYLVLTKLDTNNHNSNCIYIDGPGGSSKTFIYYLSCSQNLKQTCTIKPFARYAKAGYRIISDAK